MAKKLRTFVHVHHQGNTTVFGPADTVPEWAAKKISNPKAWVDGPEPEQTPVVVDPPPPTPPASTPPAPAGDALPEPPRAGAGSGRDAWVAYAKSRGIDDAALEGLTRDQIVELVDRGQREG